MCKNEFRCSGKNNIFGTCYNEHDSCLCDFCYLNRRKKYKKGITESEIEAMYFEGYNYQDPDIENDASDIVNQVQLYRTISGDDKNTEYVATYNDQDSIDLYGLYERKLTFSDYIDNDGITFPPVKLTARVKIKKELHYL